MGGAGGRSWAGAGEGALLYQRDSRQFTAGDGGKQDSPAGQERGRGRRLAREHARNGNEGAHLPNASLFPTHTQGKSCP